MAVGSQLATISHTGSSAPVAGMVRVFPARTPPSSTHSQWVTVCTVGSGSGSTSGWTGLQAVERSAPSTAQTGQSSFRLSAAQWVSQIHAVVVFFCGPPSGSGLPSAKTVTPNCPSSSAPHKKRESARLPFTKFIAIRLLMNGCCSQLLHYFRSVVDLTLFFICAVSL